MSFTCKGGAERKEGNKKGVWEGRLGIVSFFRQQQNEYGFENRVGNTIYLGGMASE